MLGLLGRTETEAVVVLGHQNQQLDAGFLQYGSLLPGVEIAGIEQLRVFGALAPLTTGERVDAEVGEGNELVALPGMLLDVVTRKASCAATLFPRWTLRYADLRM